MLLAQKAYVAGALALNLYCARLLDDQQTAESGGAALMVLAGRMGDSIRRGAEAGGDAATYAASLKATFDRLGEVTMGLAGLGDPVTIMANATVCLKATGHAVIA